MSVPGSANSLLLASAAGGYQISRSLRFNSADSAYLSRTPASAGNRKTWTWAGWIKRAFGFTEYFGFISLFSGGTTAATNGRLAIGFSSGKLAVDNYGIGAYATSAVFRDYSAWCHIVVAFDTTQSTASNRIKIYVNGVQQLIDTTTFTPTQNTDYAINVNQEHRIGALSETANAYWAGYLAEVHFCDGTAYDPSAFGEFDTNGIWQPKKFTGTYGSQGWKLDFADNSSNTATTLGKDTSGNGNNWTPNNLSVTAGAGNDSLVDVPTNGVQPDTGVGGEVRGNYPTLNPLAKGLNTVLSNGNLDVTGTSTADFDSAFATIQIPAAGKWYFEFTVSAHTAGFTAPLIGVSTALTATTQNSFAGANSNEFGWGASGTSWLNGTETDRSLPSVPGDVMQLAVDTDNGKIWAGRNNTWAASGNPSAGTNPLASSSTFAAALFFVVSTYQPQGAGSINFGQRPFAYPLSGFKALCTANLPEGTVTTSGTFTGNANADGPFVYLNGVPTAMTINGNAVTFGTNADKLSNGFKVRTSSGSYNTAGSNTYSISTTGAKFKNARAQSNP